MSEVLFFFEHGAEPRPKEEVRIEELNVEPYSDGQRVRLKITLTAFLERPNLSIMVTNSAGETVASSDILDVMSPQNELTIHLRGPRLDGEYTVRAELYYDQLEPVETQETGFSVGYA